MESKQFKKIYHAAIYVRLSKEDKREVCSEGEGAFCKA